MSAKPNLDRLPGRRMVINDTEERRAALPMHAVQDACDEREQAILMRFTEASEMAKHNMSVAIVGGVPRGRYAQFAGKVDFETYRDAEVSAYRWILASAFGPRAAMLAEVIAKLNGDRIEQFDFVGLGVSLAKTLNQDVALGAALGSTRVCAWMLMDAYRDYYEFWRAREAAARSGRALTDEESVRRQRRGDLTRRVIAGYRNEIDGSAS